MKEKIYDIVFAAQYEDLTTKEATEQLFNLFGGDSGLPCFSEREINFAYLMGVFNVSGIDGLQKEIERLRGLGKYPHDIIMAAREQLHTTN